MINEPELRDRLFVTTKIDRAGKVPMVRAEATVAAWRRHGLGVHAAGPRVVPLDVVLREGIAHVAAPRPLAPGLADDVLRPPPGS